MGARGKRRKRANGEVASGKQRRVPGPVIVPEIDPDQLEHGLGLLQSAVRRAGEPDPATAAWRAAYRDAQATLHAELNPTLADAVLWRATLLDGLLGWDAFRENHADLGELPTPAMLEVAAAIPTHGAETSFDVELFEDMLDERRPAAP